MFTCMFAIADETRWAVQYSSGLRACRSYNAAIANEIVRLLASLHSLSKRVSCFALF